MESGNVKIVESIIGFVRQRFPAAAATDALDGQTSLLESGIIDSLGVLDLMAFLESEHGVEIEEADYAIENFETIGHLARMVEQKRMQ